MSKPAIDSIQYAANKLRERLNHDQTHHDRLSDLVKAFRDVREKTEILAAIQAEVLCAATTLGMSGERLLETTHAKTKLDKARLDAEVRSA